MQSRLPPLPEEAFDGEKQSTTVKEFPKCKHDKVTFSNGELRCSCGAAWQGSQLHEIYKVLHG